MIRRASEEFQIRVLAGALENILTVKRTVGLALALTGALLSGSPAASAQDAPPPMEILQHALGVWNARPTPAFIGYDLNFRGTRKNREFTRDLHVQYDAGDRSYAARVLSASGSEPMGVHAERQRLFPDETFGLVPRVRAGTQDPSDARPIQTLAVERATTRYPYEVSFAGIESVRGHSAYHLHFAPRGDAERYPVRDVWIDTASFDVRRVVAHEVEHAGILSVPFLLTVEYAEAGPYWLVASGEAGATAHLVLFTISAEGAATYANYQFPQAPK